MKNYVELPTNMAHRLINHGSIILLSTRDENGVYDIAPIAWCSPVRKEPPKLLAVVGHGHQTYRNLIATGEFIACVPHVSQIEMVQKTGSVSGRDVNKFSDLNIQTFHGKKIDALVPQDCIGWIECKIWDRLALDKTDIIVGDIVHAAVDSEAFDERLLVEKPEGKTLHHLGGHLFATPELVDQDGL